MVPWSEWIFFCEEGFSWGKLVPKIPKGFWNGLIFIAWQILLFFWGLQTNFLLSGEVCQKISHRYLQLCGASSKVLIGLFCSISYFWKPNGRIISQKSYFSKEVSPSQKIVQVVKLLTIFQNFNFQNIFKLVAKYQRESKSAIFVIPLF